MKQMERLERWSPDGTMIVSGTEQGYVAVRQAISDTLWASPPHLSHRGAVRALAWSPDGTRIASGSDDTTIKIWEAKTGVIVFTYTKHTGPVLALDWSPDGRRIVSAGGQESIQIWDVPPIPLEEALAC